MSSIRGMISKRAEQAKERPVSVPGRYSDDYVWARASYEAVNTALDDMTAAEYWENYYADNRRIYDFSMPSERESCMRVLRARGLHAAAAALAEKFARYAEGK